MKHLLTRFVGLSSRKPVALFHDFEDRAASMHKKRRGAANVEWDGADLFPKISFVRVRTLIVNK
jgi:hypothetical protein